LPGGAVVIVWLWIGNTTPWSVSSLMSLSPGYSAGFTAKRKSMLKTPDTCWFDLPNEGWAKISVWDKALGWGHSQNKGPRMRRKLGLALHFGNVPHPWAFTTHKAWGKIYHEWIKST
jgi:hypothetical protein